MNTDPVVDLSRSAPKEGYQVVVRSPIRLHGIPTAKEIVKAVRDGVLTVDFGGTQVTCEFKRLLLGAKEDAALEIHNVIAVRGGRSMPVTLKLGGKAS